MTAERARVAHVIRLYLALASVIVSIPALLCFYWLRETPAFWTNAGGYPIWLRDLVRDTFLPLLGMNGLVLLLYVALFLRHPPRSARVARGEIGVILVMAGAIGTIVLLEAFEHF